MLSACGHSPATDRPRIAVDPIVTTRTVTKPVCPAEVTAPTPPKVAAYDGAEVVAPQPYFDWLTAHLRREAGLETRIADARSQCPK